MNNGTNNRSRSMSWTIIAVAAVMVGCGSSEDSPPADFERTSFAAATDAGTVTQVFDEAGTSLGSVALPVDCTVAAATEVRRGLALLHNMTHTEAETAFRRATELDDSCALGYWGQAVSWVHPVWPDVPSEEQFAGAAALLRQARTAGPASAREEAWIAAVEAYYAAGTRASESERLSAYEAAWRSVTERWPGDLEARLFHALTLVATAPGADTSFSQRIRAGELAEAVLAEIPDHPGAHHYIIHAYDVPPLAERALAAARSYGRVSPENPHALHMTSHIFTRLGLWDESIAFNERSADAALSHPVAGATSHHHLHALDYLAYAYLQQGRDAEAADVMGHLESLEGPVVDNVVTAYAFAAVPVRIALERREWATAAALPVGVPESLSWRNYPHLEALVQFGRALGSTHAGDLAAAEAAADRLDVLQTQAAALPGVYDWGAQVEIQALAARAWITRARGDDALALSLMTQAADLEAVSQKHPVTPGEVLPAHELLGDMLLEMGRYAEARDAYEASLRRSPSRLNGLFGSARAAELAGESAAARRDYRLLLDLAGSNTGLPQVERASAFLGTE
jgi:tetratricopeptide (TPR) repeat protein